jgi:hypothetical protein
MPRQVLVVALGILVGYLASAAGGYFLFAVGTYAPFLEATKCPPGSDRFLFESPRPLPGGGRCYFHVSASHTNQDGDLTDRIGTDFLLNSTPQIVN